MGNCWIKSKRSSSSSLSTSPPITKNNNNSVTSPLKTNNEKSITNEIIEEENVKKDPITKHQVPRERSFINAVLPPKNHSYIPFLSSSWPGSILQWSKEDINDFAACFTPLHFKDGAEIQTEDPKAFFIVVEGLVEVHAILPTKSKKTANIREFLCKKDVGDMVYLPSIRNLISISNAKEMYEKESARDEHHTGHKNILKVLDTVSIKSVNKSTILLMDWTLFEKHFGSRCTTSNHEGKVNPDVGAIDLSNQENKSSLPQLDVNMLRLLMETNLTDYLQNIPILEGVSTTKLELLSRLCKYSVVQNGDNIFQEGDEGDDVFILLSGEVKVDAKASKRMVELFEEGVLEPPPPPQQGFHITSNSSSSSTSEHMTRNSIASSIRNRRKPRRDSIGKATMVQRRRTLHMARHQCQKEKVIKSPDNDLSKAGSSLTDGGHHSRLDILDPDHSVELARFHAGDYFGEMATFIGLPRVATVSATTNVLMASLSNASFRTLYHVIFPDLEASVESIVKNHMLQTLLQSKSPFMERIDTNLASQMAEVSTISKLDEGTIVFNENDEADKFYFVYSGHLAVEKKHLKQMKDNPSISPETSTSSTIGFLYPGDYFGEMALINKSKRLATITCRTKTVLIGITRDNFHQCFQKTPQLIAELVVRMRGHKVKVDEVLNHQKSLQSFIEYLTTSNQKHVWDCYQEIKEHQGRSKVNEGGSVTADDDAQRKTAIHIMQKYFTTTVVDQSVNLSPELLQVVEQESLSTMNKSGDSTDRSDVDKSILLPAMDHINMEIFPGLLEGFKKSKEFELLMKRMRAYDELDMKLLA